MGPRLRWTIHSIFLTASSNDELDTTMPPDYESQEALPSISALFLVVFDLKIGCVAFYISNARS